MLPLLALLACAHSPRSTEALFPEAVTVMAHRGASHDAPENTLAAFQRAVDLGVPMELDVHLTADGVLAVIHDDVLDTTTDGHGPVSEATAAQLATLDAGSSFDAAFAGEPVPTLDQVFALVQGRVVVNVEAKAPKGTDNAALAAAIAAAVERAGAKDRVMVSSFSPFFLEQLKLVDPDLPRGQLYGTFRDSDLKGYEKVILRRLWLNGKADADILVMEHPLARRGYLRRMHRKGYRMMVWTVDDPERIRELVDLGVDGVITNDPATAQGVVGP